MSNDELRAKPALYIFGTPGKLGGASTKICHLIRLLHKDFQIRVIPREIGISRDKEIKRLVEPYGVKCMLLKDLPRKLEGIALAICERHFFVSGTAVEAKRRGLRLVWSNEMMWPFMGEAEAISDGLVDRVLLVSDFQAEALADIYNGTPTFKTGNFIDPDDYSWRERRNEIFCLGRLSRPDVKKYPLDFPVFYQEMGLKEVRYRVMAWSDELRKQFRWHRFGPEWDLLPVNSESALKFLYSLDVFLYPLGHRIKESWGRAVVEAMLTGCVPVVPHGHQFHHLMVNGQTGFICHEFQEYRDCVRELYENYPLRQKIARQASEHAREDLCNPQVHRRTWIEALTF